MLFLIAAKPVAAGCPGSSVFYLSCPVRGKASPGNRMVLRLFLSAAAITMSLELLAPSPSDASFVHSVGRDYMIREWVDQELDSVLVEITPIMHEGNPAYRVSFRPRSDAPDSRPTEILVRADDFRDMKPVLVHPRQDDG